MTLRLEDVAARRGCFTRADGIGRHGDAARGRILNSAKRTAPARRSSFLATLGQVRIRAPADKRYAASLRTIRPEPGPR